MTQPAPPQTSSLTHHLARLILASFLFTFLTARILVIYIMAGKLPPQLFFHLEGTHIHHLNYGISLLSLTGAYLLFARPLGHKLSLAAIIYAIGLALTYDEFGMWLHLGGPYWQRASFDAITIIALLLALIAYGSTIRHWKPRHHITLAALLVLLIIFGFLFHYSLQYADQTLGPKLLHLEDAGPS
jgi:hypothetical protein